VAVEFCGRRLSLEMFNSYLAKAALVSPKGTELAMAGIAK
jgi:hypothetical protein